MDLVIGGDTVVAHEGKILEKPRDHAHAAEMYVPMPKNPHCAPRLRGFSRDAPVHVSGRWGARALKPPSLLPGQAHNAQRSHAYRAQRGCACVRGWF